MKNMNTFAVFMRRQPRCWPLLLGRRPWYGACTRDRQFKASRMQSSDEPVKNPNRLAERELVSAVDLPLDD